MQTRLPLSRTRPIRDTLAIMAMLVRRRRGDQRVREAAHRIVSGAAPLNEYDRMVRVREFIRRSMPFERDPRGTEAINDPLLSLEKIAAYGEAAGDCDDASVLIAALLESIGVRTRFAALSVRADRQLHHVAVEAFDRRAGRWVYLDPYAPHEVGRQPKFTAAMRAAV